jgi:signal transduction histidine kinase
MANQIAEFHGGAARAENRADGSGVVFELRFPVATYT